MSTFFKLFPLWGLSDWRQPGWETEKGLSGKPPLYEVERGFGGEYRIPLNKLKPICKLKNFPLNSLVFRKTKIIYTFAPNQKTFGYGREDKIFRRGA